MDDAKAAIRRTPGQVKSFLAQEAPPRLSEPATEAHFIETIVAMRMLFQPRGSDAGHHLILRR